jgi:dipeptidyl aminopeptidase/acylaminoacyl peptidase
MRTLLISLCLIAIPFTVVRAQVEQLPYLDQLPPLLDRELFFGDPEVSGPQLSPDGQWMTFLRPHLGVRNIWVKRASEPFEAARPITADTTRPVSGYFWSRDSRYVLYVQDRGGDENFHVYAVDPGGDMTAGGVPAARNLTPYDGARALIYGVPKATPDQIIVGLNDRDPQWHDVYRVNLDTGNRELIRENTEEIAGWTFDLNGRLRLASRTTGDGSTEVLRVDDDGSFSKVYECSVFETCGPVRFHRDHQRVYMVSNRGEDADLIRLVLFDPATGQERVIEQDPEGEVDFGGAEFSNATDELTATYYVGDRVRIYPKTEAASRTVTMLQDRFPGSQFSMGSATADDRLQLVRVYSDTDPGATYLLDHESGELQFVYRLRPDLPGEHLAEMRPIRYTARDGVVVPAYLTLPKGVTERHLAVIVVPHGGPWSRDTWGYDSFAQFLSNRGYAVLQPNFRGSTGYGKEFLNLGNAQWGTGTMQHDITDGVQYLIEQGIADPDRVGIMGGSYGGYATLAGLTYTPDVYAAGVSIVGPSNLLTLLNTIPPYWAAIRTIFNVRMGDPSVEADAARLREQSPFFHADRIRAPLLVVQGANDPRVKQSESDQIVVAARENDVQVEYMVAPDEGHGFAGLENRMAMMVAIERFFNVHLGGRAQDEVPADIQERLADLMVDVNTVVLPEFATEEELRSDLPTMDGSLLNERTLRYHTSMELAGQRIDLEVQRAITEAVHEGRPVWRSIEQFSMPAAFGGMASVDTFDVDRATLLPVRRHARSMATMEFDYHGDRIQGEMRAAGQTMPFNVALDAPVLGDGAGLDMALAGMPLAPGFETVVRTFSPAEQVVRSMRLVVEGEDVVEVPAGQFAAYRIQMTPIDGSEGSQTIHVTTEAPHIVVQSSQRLPAAMGGGTMTSRLEWME